MRSAGSGACEAEVLDGGGENDPQEEVPGPQDPGPQVNRHSASASLWTELQASEATLLPAPREAAGPPTKRRPGAGTAMESQSRSLLLGEPQGMQFMNTVLQHD